MIEFVRRAQLGLAGLAMLGSAAFAAPDPVSRIDPATLEYRLSWGVGGIRAERAYRRGEAGKDVTVAMIDTGLSSSAGSLFARLSPASTDLVLDRSLGDIGTEHGRHTATLLASARDGTGMMGVAYDATLLEIRADIDGSCVRTCAMTGATVARGIDYAIAKGARVIGLPVSSLRPLPSIEPALERAARAGVLIVAAAGNTGEGEPVWPARYAADPRFRGAILVAGASDRKRALAAWSNRAGSTASHYLTAPGESILVDCDSRVCGVVSGTSYSVSYVAGAAAILLGRYPGLDAPAAAGLLLRAAANGDRPLATNGRGALNVARAMRLGDRAAS